MTPKMKKAVVHKLAKVTMPRHKDNMVLLNQGSTVVQAGTDNSMADILLSSKVMASLRRHQDMASLPIKVMASLRRHQDMVNLPSRVMASLRRNKDMVVHPLSSLATPRNKANTVRHLRHRDIRRGSIMSTET